MNKNPYYNAVLASAYIVFVGMFMSNARLFFGEHDTALTPVMVLSLFVLSAAIMGYLFIGEPIMLFLDGHKKQAVDFFWRTVATFACITILLFIVSAIIGQAH
jgi:hypothetical protein